MAESVSCIMCRKRKIKCDRTPITCTNCQKFGEECSYAETSTISISQIRVTPTTTTTQAGLQRRRVLQSCVACKRAKSKCSGGTPCSRCAKRSNACVYAPRGTKPQVGGHVEGLVEGLVEGQDDAVRGESTAFLQYAQQGSQAEGYGEPSPTRVKLEYLAGEDGYADTHTQSPTVAQPSPPIQTPVLSWLMESPLPAMERLCELIELYFVRIHTVRCMGFLHKVDFLARLRDQRTLYADECGLVHAICALAAPFYYADKMTADGVARLPLSGQPVYFFEAGSGWAAAALQCVFARLGTPDIESLMTEVLLHEYYLRCGEYAKGFMLSGIAARHIQLLQLNLECNYDLLCQGPLYAGNKGDSNCSIHAGREGTVYSEGSECISWTTKECRRRVVWSCFLLDSLIECGIDQLRFVNPADIQVQLPCTEDLFERNVPCVTELLLRGKLLPFAPAGSNGSDHLGLQAYYIRCMEIRSRILKYVKHLDGDVPWSKNPGETTFGPLDSALQELADSIPPRFAYSEENTSIFRAQHRLNLYYGLHILLAQTTNDLYRVCVDKLVYPHHATQWIRSHAPPDFLLRCHQVCANKAVHIATLLAELWRLDPCSLIDTPYSIHVQVCSSVLVTTICSWKNLKEEIQGHKLFSPEVSPERLRLLLQSNVEILDYYRRLIKADAYYESARQALRKFDEMLSQGNALQWLTADNRQKTPDEVKKYAPQFSLEYILNPLGVYPLARQQARGRHEPESVRPGTLTIRAGAAREEPRYADVGASIASCTTDNTMFDVAFPSAQVASSSAVNVESGHLATGTDHANFHESMNPQTWDWESEMHNVASIGYPTFLTESS